MIDFRNVSVGLKGKKIIDNCSFRLQKGQITVLIGRNGSGKTTLINCINGMMRYTGEIRICGENAALLSRRERARRVAILPQRLPDTRLSVRGLVSVGRNPYVDPVGRLDDEDRKIVQQSIENAGIAHLTETDVGLLSGGERQRAFIAMLLAQDTPVLVLDEPTTYLDIDARKELLRLLADLSRKKDKTLMVIMHDINEAVNIADNIVLLDQGKCLFSGTKEAFLAEKLAEKHFGLRHFDVHDGTKTEVFFR